MLQFIKSGEPADIKFTIGEHVRYVYKSAVAGLQLFDAALSKEWQTERFINVQNRPELSKVARRQLDPKLPTGRAVATKEDLSDLSVKVEEKDVPNQGVIIKEDVILEELELRDYKFSEDFANRILEIVLTGSTKLDDLLLTDLLAMHIVVSLIGHTFLKNIAAVIDNLYTAAMVEWNKEVVKFSGSSYGYIHIEDCKNGDSKVFEYLGKIMNEILTTTEISVIQWSRFMPGNTMRIVEYVVKTELVSDEAAFKLLDVSDGEKWSASGARKYWLAKKYFARKCKDIEVEKIKKILAKY